MGLYLYKQVQKKKGFDETTCCLHPGQPLYIGVNSDLIQRVWLHRQGCVSSFTKKYHVNQLVYFELCSDISAAIIREKQLKKWNRLWKIRLIEQTNPNWNDLWSEIVGV